jgi:autotransporter passenger strand-loop-strand repeat protein
VLSGGSVTVGSGIASATTLSGGTEVIDSGGTDIAATVSSGGTAVIGSGGTDISTTVSGGGSEVVGSGGLGVSGLAASTTIAGGTLDINAPGPVALHPAFGSERADIALVMDALGYAPFRVTGPAVEAVRTRLAKASELAGCFQLLRDGGE